LTWARQVLYYPLSFDWGCFLFTINWENVPEHGLKLDGNASVVEFSTLVALQNEGACRFEGELKFELEARWVSGMLQVHGEAACDAFLPCSRCLKEFPRRLAGYFDLTFVREMPEISISDDDDEGYELSADELGLVHAPEDEIDLHDAFAEQLVLALPVRPLCGAECAGLCPRCGKDLNTGPCNCEEEVFNNRFAALKNLKIEKE